MCIWGMILVVRQWVMLDNEILRPTLCIWGMSLVAGQWAMSDSVTYTAKCRRITLAFVYSRGGVCESVSLSLHTVCCCGRKGLEWHTYEWILVVPFVFEGNGGCYLRDYWLFFLLYFCSVLYLNIGVLVELKKNQSNYVFHLFSCLLTTFFLVSILWADHKSCSGNAYMQCVI